MDTSNKSNPFCIHHNICNLDSYFFLETLIIPYSPKILRDLPKIFQNLTKILGNLAKIFGNIAKISGNLAKISPRYLKIVENLAKILGHLTEINQWSWLIKIKIHYFFLTLTISTNPLLAAKWRGVSSNLSGSFSKVFERLSSNKYWIVKKNDKKEYISVYCIILAFIIGQTF